MRHPHRAPPDHLGGPGTTDDSTGRLHRRRLARVNRGGNGGHIRWPGRQSDTPHPTHAASSRPYAAAGPDLAADPGRAHHATGRKRSWVAVWGGGEIRRYQADGRLLHTRKVPSPQPTSVCVHPSDFRILITTARYGLTHPTKASGAVLSAPAPARAPETGHWRQA
ncbi:SMP-30/gluconolactonase/LRE family protein [Streptomyces sp. KM273126]|uniref:SMP-30/gluconolactonase/LRE family protein n=1 Tax=Streptomyces sp. KM273126 TaxID=2545247 RepID=UPI00215DC12D|nr:SMP-30/gluconolactonase/LRE family protein [Streptomyces sp. KM273126]